MSGEIVGAIARHELRITLRSRWVLVYAMVFAALTLAVSYFGLAVIEFTGFQEFDRTAVSLLNLVLYIVPLATMLMAVQSFRPEGGATDQLFAEPVTRAEILLGKLAGLSAAHVLATVLGFSFTGVLIVSKVGPQGLSSYLVLVGFTILVGIVFLALATMLAVLTHRSARTYAVVLVAWFVAVLLFDLVIVGLSFLLPEFWANRTAFAGVFLNPIDATRVATLLAISGREMFGPAGAQLVRTMGGVPQAVVLLCAALLAWIVCPAAIGIAALRRQDI
ncbi:MAG: ABC transporter permease subunit [bacterium]|nr:ABC transporter permease subunit [bacterium]